MEPGNNEHVTAMSVKMQAEIVSYGDGLLRGALFSKYFEEPYVFTDLVRMIEMMEMTFDTKGFPEKTLLPRTFGKPKQRLRKNELDLNAFMKESTVTSILPEHEGIKRTFEISVRYRHSAEWQGNIYIVEKNEHKDFTSILEMLKIIDDALVE